MAVVATVVLMIVFARPNGQDKPSELLLEAASSAGPDPYTESSARQSSPPLAPPALANVARGVAGSAPGLYGGTRNASSCGVEKQISSLTAEPVKARVFASVQGIEVAAVPGYLRSLTPVQLRLDTRVTNHGYRNGAPTRYQAVLQAGTAVLVDGGGEPRVRCACGNPLLPPVAVKGTPRRTGDSWPGYRSANAVLVTPAPAVVEEFILFDRDSGDWFARHRGDTGADDRKTSPPASSLFLFLPVRHGAQFGADTLSVPVGDGLAEAVAVRTGCTGRTAASHGSRRREQGQQRQQRHHGERAPHQSSHEPCAELGFTATALKNV
ncbi:DUF6777 domain-containing protein [Streptomyces sp. NPDC052236]|uniref:DUF6777 domain-containing protein n=1 Tax=Streptomyces sp. NPDC052236 TaxID=3365686 RepID=UPI0037CCF246